ncbi:MAG TPA: hypothetical protein PLN21_16710 [Gemmatales bacterium]|nr:hypothetical protein [Gemmatales bacterium]
MSAVLLYFCPVDHCCLDQWNTWAESVVQALLWVPSDEEVKPFPAVRISNSPVFTYDGQLTPIATLSKETTIEPSAIEVRHWSTIVYYSAVAIVIGEDIDVTEVKKRLCHLQLLNQHLNGFDLKGIKLALYHHCAILDLKFRQFINRGGFMVYLTGWYQEDPEEQKWVLQREPKPVYDVCVIQPNDDSRDYEIWSNSNGNNLIAISLASSFIDALISVFHENDDLQPFLGKWKIKEPMITFNRNHTDDTFSCTYNLPLFDVPLDWLAVLI